MEYERKAEKLLSGVVIIAGALFLAGICREAFQPVIIGDETFSMKLAENRYWDIVRLTAQDVHPPLYYWILKSIVSLQKIIPVNAVMLGKLASVVPYFLLAFLSFTKIRRAYGMDAAGLFFLSVTGMPRMMHYAVEIRMYSWGMFFLVVVYLSFCDIIQDRQNKWTYVRFVLFSLFAAYTHYFSCIAASFFYIVLFLYFLWKDRRKIKIWILCSVITAVGYLPWLPVLYEQMNTVRAGYWIESVSLHTLLSFFQFIFNPSVYRFHSGTILGILSCFLVFAVVGLPLLRKGGKENRKQFCALAGAGEVFFVIAMGVVISWCMRPILVERYLFFGFGVLWLGFAIGFSMIKKSYIRTGIVLFILGVACLNFKQFLMVEEESRTGWEKAGKILSEVESDDVILANLGETRLMLSYQMPEIKVCYYWRQTTEDLFHGLYGNLIDTRDEEEIFHYLKVHNQIYFFDTIDIGEFHLKDDCTQENIIFEDMGTCLLEDVGVHVYIIRRGE